MSVKHYCSINDSLPADIEEKLCKYMSSASLSVNNSETKEESIKDSKKLTMLSYHTLSTASTDRDLFFSKLKKHQRILKAFLEEKIFSYDNFLYDITLEANKHLEEIIKKSQEKINEKNTANDELLDYIYFLSDFISKKDQELKKIDDITDSDYEIYAFSCLKFCKKLKNLLSFEKITSLREKNILKKKESEKIKINCEKSKRLTLILDLDETLIRAEPINEKSSKKHDFYICNKSIGINIRPNLFKFLDFCKDNFSLILFSAGHKEYVQNIVSKLGVEKYFDMILTRKHCLNVDGIYIKDLSIIPQFDQEHTLILDNNILSFALNLDNGIHVNSYYGDDEDEYLLECTNHLEELLHEHKTSQLSIKKINGDCFMYEVQCSSIKY